MKKIVALLLAFATLLALPACGKNTAQVQESTEIVLTEATDPQTEPHQHQYNITIILPSCTTDGYTSHSCACGDSYTDEVVPALGHSFGDWVTTLEPTETTTGLEERKCTTCNTADTHVLGVLIAGHVHSYEDVVKKPDCVNGGYTTHTCSGCKDSYVDAYTAALGHAFDVKIVPATCQVKGKKTTTCTRCDAYKKEEVLPKVGCDYTEATCTQPSACRFCKRVNGNPRGHSYGSDHLCTRCGAADPNNQPTASATYKVTIRSDKGDLLPGITVTVYVGETQVGSGTTDNQGVAKMTLSGTGSSYKLVLSNVPEAYEAKESYIFSSITVSVNLKTVPVLDPNDHSKAMYTTGSTMANFVLTDVDGNVYDLSQLRQEKKLIILDFWYVNCGPCKKEFPYFEAMLEQYSDDVILLAINNLDSEDSIRNLRTELNADPATAVSFPMLRDTLGITQGFGVTAYPLTAFIDPEGKVVFVHQDAFSSQSAFITQVERFLR